MPRQRRRYDTQSARDLTDLQSFGASANKQAKNRHARILGQRGEGFYGGILIHISIMPELPMLDKEVSRL